MLATSLTTFSSIPVCSIWKVRKDRGKEGGGRIEKGRVLKGKSLVFPFHVWEKRRMGGRRKRGVDKNNVKVKRQDQVARISETSGRVGLAHMREVPKSSRGRRS